MSPTYTMSAHLCKQIYSSWRQTRHTSPEPNSPLPSPPTSVSYLARRSPSPEKRSMEDNRSETSPLYTRPTSSSSSSGNWGSR